jgi:hypothetical protein
VHSPTEGNYKEHLLFDLLNESGGAKLAICCDDGLQTPEARRVREKVAIAEAQRRGLKCLNKAKSDSRSMQRFQLRSKEKVLQKELERVRAKLEKLDLTHQTDRISAEPLEAPLDPCGRIKGKQSARRDRA